MQKNHSNDRIPEDVLLVLRRSCSGVRNPELYLRNDLAHLEAEDKKALLAAASKTEADLTELRVIWAEITGKYDKDPPND